MLSVVHNMTMQNAERMFGIVSGKKRKSTEKLSSGYKVNRASDDAAGLSISEKMRRQIRGLQKGSENIQEGISLVQTADGALDEVVDMLQRMNELSVKAYNGTNTKEDRKYIQAEINQLISEIGRIADTTTFNEIPLFKGTPVKRNESVIEIKAPTLFPHTQSVPATIMIPDWLKKGVDEKLEVHSTYVGKQQTEGCWMYKTLKNPDGSFMVDADGNVQYEYYGEDIGDKALYGADHVREWTEEISDNPTAKISFAGLLDSKDATELYNNMYALIGSSIGVPCGTCSEKYYSISFTGKVDGYTAKASEFANGRALGGGQLDMTDLYNPDFSFTSYSDPDKKITCFDKIKELLVKQANDDVSTDAEKQAETARLAGEIASKLRDATFNVVDNVMEYKDHFDRALKSDVYDIIVYDYRDVDALTGERAADSRLVLESYAEIEQTMMFLDPGESLIERTETEEPMVIVASAQFGDWISFDLPFITLETLGIKDYDVARYSGRTVVKEEIADSFWKRCEESKEANEAAWKNYDAWLNSYREVEEKDYVQAKRLVKTIPPIIADVYINGELKKELCSTKRREGL